MSDEIQFGKLNPDGSLTDVRQIKRSDIAACPHFILAQEHYRPDGSCRCDDPEATAMSEWGYEWKEGQWR